MSDESQRAREAALRLLTYRARSFLEIRRHLERKGFGGAVIDEVIGALSAAGLLDDRSFARNWVEYGLSSRGMGPVRLAWELRQRGVAEEYIAEALGDVTAEREREVAAGLVERRRVKGVSEETKLVSFLLRRGFTSHTVRAVTGEDPEL